MKRIRLLLSVLLITLLALTSLVACAKASTDEVVEDLPFSYSDGIDDNGYWKDIRALDYVELLDYDKLEIPSDIHNITDDKVQAEVDNVLSSYATAVEVTDRTVEDGDTLNIDFVGSIDGVPFENGSTDGAGAEVTIGETSYVDDFLEQLIGHTPGETLDVEVTFPQDYGNDELNGKDAVFVVTINSIIETSEPELTDDFVVENLQESYGWTTIKEMEDVIRADLRETAIFGYVQDCLVNDVTVSSIPEFLAQYQENMLVAYYEEYAAQYGVEMDEFLSGYVGVESLDQLKEESQEDMRLTSVYSLAIQAIAEDKEMIASDEDVSDYFLEYVGDADYSSYAEQFGLPYVKQVVLGQKVLDYIVEHAVFK
jgi:trigger factor